jgi:signal transduction histidine kinase
MAQRTALYENMMTGISDGVAILSDQGQIVAHNDRLGPLLRVDPSRLSTRPRLQDLVSNAGWHSSDGPAGLSSLSLASGPVIELRESALPGGGTVVLIADATERRQMEDRLRQIQRIEALGKVSGEVAHDFGNILSTIAGNLHMMDTASPARQAALLQSIGVAVDLGASLTGRLLAFARRQHLEPETVDLPQLVEGMADLVGFALREEIELDISTGAQPLPVRVNPGQMESAILNLCLNAGQAIAGPGRISVDVRQCGPHAVIEVSDTGAGMAPEVLAHAMEPFFSARADGTGTGLGLAMVYGFIRQSGGDVQISSTLGQGTSVRLSLPLCTSPETLPALGRVVLVEDDPRDRATAQEVLAQMSKTLNVAPDARAALALLDQPVDLFVTDLSLHGQIEGWRLAKAALARWPDARALVVSGHLPQSNPLVAQYPGRIATLAKPLSTDSMRHALASLSQKAQRHDTPAQP